MKSQLTVGLEVIQ